MVCDSTADLPPGLRDKLWNFAYQYAAVPYELQLRIAKVHPFQFAEPPEGEPVNILPAEAPRVRHQAAESSRVGHMGDLFRVHPFPP